eukprot:scaffold200691_cov33-Tisochrysis_lutea.AAC.4
MHGRRSAGPSEAKHDILSSLYKHVLAPQAQIAARASIHSRSSECAPTLKCVATCDAQELHSQILMPEHTSHFNPTANHWRASIHKEMDRAAAGIGAHAGSSSASRNNILGASKGWA